MLDASLARDDLRPNKTVCLSHIFDTDFRIDLSNLGDAALRLKKERQIRCRRQSSLWATGCSVLN